MTRQITINIDQIKFPSDEADLQALNLGEAAEMKLRNLQADTIEDIVNLNYAQLGELKYVEAKAKLQGQLQAYSHVLELSLFAKQYFLNKAQNSQE